MDKPPSNYHLASRLYRFVCLLVLLIGGALVIGRLLPPFVGFLVGGVWGFWLFRTWRALDL